MSPAKTIIAIVVGVCVVGLLIAVMVVYVDLAYG